MFLLFLTLGAFAQLVIPNRGGESKGFEVIAKHYPDNSYPNSPYVKVFWGEEMNPNYVDFEDGVIPSGWDNDFPYPWVVTNQIPGSGYNGSYCMMSGNAGVGNSSSTIQVTFDFGTSGGSISFNYGCYGESTSGSMWDVCRFFIDDEQIFSYGANQYWDSYTAGVTAGTHTFMWSYTKDGFTDSPGDGFYVDDVTFEVGAKGRADTQYNLYRQQVNTPSEVEPELIAEGISVTEYIDSTWLSLAEGSYQYGVEIVGSTAAGEFWSNTLTKAEAAVFQIQVWIDLDTVPPAGTISGGGTYYYGDACTLTATINPGYQLFYWEAMSDTTMVGNYYDLEYTFTVTKDESYRAIVMPISLYPMVYAEPEGAGEAGFQGDDELEYLRLGDQATIVATSADPDNYQFVNWTCKIFNQSFVLSTEATCTFSVDEDFLNHFDFYNLYDEDGYPYEPSVEGYGIDIIANFAQRFNVTATVNPEGSGTIYVADTVFTGGSFEPDASLTMVAQPNEGYTFARWDQDGQMVVDSPTLTTTIEYSTDFVAYFDRIKFYPTVYWDDETYGTAEVVLNDDECIYYGDMAKLHATAFEGYQFVSWSVFDEEGNQHVFSYQANDSVTMDYSFLNGILVGHENEGFEFYATFEPQTFEITVSVDPEVGGAVYVSDTLFTGGTFQYETEIFMIAQNNPGYAFVNWTVNGTEVGTVHEFDLLVTENADIVAHFEPVEYIVSFIIEPNDGGEAVVVSHDDNTFHFGDEVTFQALPADGYDFVNWTLGESNDEIELSTDPNYTFTLNSDHLLAVQNPTGGSVSITANFELQTFAITAIAQPEIGGAVYVSDTLFNGGTLAYGTEITMDAVANENYKLDQERRTGEY